MITPVIEDVRVPGSHLLIMSPSGAADAARSDALSDRANGKQSKNKKDSALALNP
jgi:hypothetical protein